jgi:hypothetical protein
MVEKMKDLAALIDDADIVGILILYGPAYK